VRLGRLPTLSHAVFASLKSCRSAHEFSSSIGTAPVRSTKRSSAPLRRERNRGGNGGSSSGNDRLQGRLDTGALGWGGRIRTSAWRNQNPLPYRLATPQSAWVPGLDLSGLFAGHKCGFDGNNGGTFQRWTQAAPKLAAEQTGEIRVHLHPTILVPLGAQKKNPRDAASARGPVRCANGVICASLGPVDKATEGDRTRKFGFQLRRDAAKFTTSSREGRRSSLWRRTPPRRCWGSCSRPRRSRPSMRY
jgi:hypothetical protein